MKLSIIRILIFSLFLFPIFCSCVDNIENENDMILRNAEILVDENPAKALEMLNSIVDPSLMDEEDYMKYIVTRIASKHESQQDISQDTLIYRAKKHFTKTKNTPLLAKASFYEAWISYQNDQIGHAIAGFIESEYLANQIGDNKLSGKSTNNIGYIYYHESVLDSALIYFKKSVEHHLKVPNNDVFTMRSKISLGITYEALGEFELAQTHTLDALNDAIRINNKEYEARLKNNLGLILIRKKDYKSAKKQLFEALNINEISEEDMIKVNLNLSHAYHASNELDSAKYYVDLVYSKTSNSSDKFFLHYVYSIFRNYYKSTGDYEQALHYSQLDAQIKERITKENRALELQKARMNQHIQKKEKDLDEANTNNIFYLLSSLSLILFLGIITLICIWWMSKSNNRNMKKAERIIDKYSQKAQSLLLLQGKCLDSLTQLIEDSSELDLSSSKNDEKQKHIKYTLSKIREANTDQLHHFSKNILEDHISDPSLIDNLNEEYAFLLSLFICKYSEKQIMAILNKSKDQILLQKIELQNLLQVKGFSDSQIESFFTYLGNQQLSR